MERRYLHLHQAAPEVLLTRVSQDLPQAPKKSGKLFFSVVVDCQNVKIKLIVYRF